MDAAAVFNAMYEKRAFLARVFLTLFVQLCITYYVMNRKTNPDANIIVLFIALIAIVFILSAVSLPEPVKLLLFTIFSYLFGLVFSKLKEDPDYNSESINVAIMGAASVFLSMMVVGIALLAGGIRLGYKFGLLLFFSLLALIIARLVFFVTAGSGSGSGSKMSDIRKAFSSVGIFIFALYVLYTTNSILQRNYRDNYISASLAYYLDFINLFSSSYEHY
jgi:FtsH-binding integral membrane protein